jgi:cell division protein FtsQ
MRTSTAIKIKSYRGTYKGASTIISRRKKVQRIKSVVFSVFKFTILLSLFYFVVVGGYEGYKYVMASPYFDVSNIAIDGNINLKREDILSASSIKIGQSIFSVNIGDVYKRLKGNPWIKDVAVKKEMPDRLKIKINERRPAAILKSNRLYLMDNEGVILEEASGDSETSLPLIVKPMDLEFKAGDRVNSEEVFNSINIWERLQGVKLNLADSPFKDSIATIEPISSDKVKINLKDTNSYIVINDEDIDNKFKHLQIVMRSLGDKENMGQKGAVQNEGKPSLKEGKGEEVKELDYIDLSFKDKVVVKYK